MTLASDAYLVKLDCLKANEGCKFKTLELPFDKAHGILETHMKRKHGDKTAETKSFSIRSSFKKQANNLIHHLERGKCHIKIRDLRNDQEKSILGVWDRKPPPKGYNYLAIE